MLVLQTIKIAKNLTMTTSKTTSSRINFTNITKLLETAEAEGRNTLHEHEVYNLLDGLGCGAAQVRLSPQR